MDRLATFFGNRRVRLGLSVCLLIAVAVFFTVQASKIIGEKKPMWFTEIVSANEVRSVSATVFADETVIPSDSIVLTDLTNGVRIPAQYTIGRNAYGDVVSTAAGYYYGFVDGYEGVLSADAAKSLTVASYPALIAAGSYADPHSVKVLTDHTIYFAVIADDAISGRVTVGKQYPAVTDDGERSFTLTAISTESNDAGSLTVFSCNDYPMRHIGSRTVEFDLVIETHSGISVPKDAVYSYGNYSRVFVFESGYARQRDIKIIFETDDYYIVGGNISDRELIIREKGLYNGKVMK